MTARTLILAAAAVALAGPALAQQEAEGATCPGRITVQGEGSVQAVPDLLRVTFEVEAEADAPGTALQDASADTQAVLDALKAQGIAARDISTTEVSLIPVRDQTEANEPPKTVGWRAASALRVSVRDTSAFGSLADAATQAGATGIGGVALEVSDPSQKLKEARQAAIREALARAETLAGAAEMTLGDVLEINDQGGGGIPRPMFARAAAMESADMPIAAGEQTVTASISMTLALCQ